MYGLLFLSARVGFRPSIYLMRLVSWGNWKVGSISHFRFTCLYKEVYLQIFKCVSFWLHGCCGEWESWARKPVNHTSWVTVVTPTDRPKSVRNCCVIEFFVTFLVLSLCPFDIFADEGAFVIGSSQISSFFSQIGVVTLASRPRLVRNRCVF